MTHTGSIIFTDEEVKTLTAQWQTVYFRELLRTPDVVSLLLEPAYKFFKYITSNTIDTHLLYCVWKDSARDIMEKLSYDFAVQMNGPALKDIVGAVYL